MNKREAEWRNIAAGFCRYHASVRRVSAQLCRRCLEKHREVMRTRYRELRGIPLDAPITTGRPRAKFVEAR